jgi:hypothetical protein
VRELHHDHHGDKPPLATPQAMMSSHSMVIKMSLKRRLSVV